MWRVSRGAEARPPEAWSGPQVGWDHDVVAVVRGGCAPGSADSVGWPVEPGLNQWKARIEHIRDRPGRRFSACGPEEMGTFPTATSYVFQRV